MAGYYAVLAVLLLLHGVILLPDATSYDKIFYSDNLHVDRHIQCPYIQDLTGSFELICKAFPEIIKKCCKKEIKCSTNIAFLSFP